MEEKQKGYYHTKASVSEYVAMTEGMNGNALIKKIREHLKPKTSLLEIGSGPGNDWELLSKHYHTTGSDNSEAFLKHLSQRHPNGTFISLDAANPNPGECFDGIYSNKVLHHLTDEELVASIETQSDILNEEGIICHSFWEGEGDEYFKGLYVNNHTAEELETLFSVHFEILHISHYAEFEKGDSVLLVARKKG